MRIQHQLDIDAPPSVVWELTTDIESLPDHTPTMSAVTLLDPAPISVGTRVRIKQPAQRAKVWVVDELEVNERFGWTTSSAFVTMKASHQLAEIPGGTTNTLTVDIDGRLAPIIGRLVRPFIRRALAAENHGLKAAAEQHDRVSSR